MNRSAHDPGSQQPAPGPGVAGVVTGDLVCLQCGYNLRTLSHAGCCPECGRPVWHSVTFVDLRYAPPAYVEGLAAGAAMLTRCCSVGRGATLPLAAACAAAALIPAQQALIILTVTFFTSTALALALLSLGCIATWTLTVPDPRGTPYRIEGTTRRSLRRALVGSLCFMCAGGAFVAAAGPEVASASTALGLVSLLTLPRRLAARLQLLADRLVAPELRGSATAAANISLGCGVLAIPALVGAFVYPLLGALGFLLVASALHVWHRALRQSAERLHATAESARPVSPESSQADTIGL